MKTIWVILTLLAGKVALATPLLPVPTDTLVTCDVARFGAKGNGITKDTVSIQAAIDQCAKTGGTVLLHDGVFLSGMITLKSNITLNISSSATLMGTQDDLDYPDTHPKTDNSQLNNCRKALVYAEGVQNLTIEGDGTIDGNGGKASWIGSSAKTPEKTRPMAVYIVQSNQVLLQNFHMKDAAMWGIVNLETDNLTIRNLDIHTPFGGTRDGIDIVDTHHVLIENNKIFSEDDSICLKSGTARGVEDVLVQNNRILQSTVANGLKLGTASTGGFKNITFVNNNIQDVDKAAMAVESIDGAVIENVEFKNINFKNAGTAFFILLGMRKADLKKPVGSIDGVHFEHIQGNAMKHSWGSAISGSILNGVRYALKNITFNDVRVTYAGDSSLHKLPVTPPEYAGEYPDPNLWGDLPASGIFFRHIDGLHIGNSQLNTLPLDTRPTLLDDDVL